MARETVDVEPVPEDLAGLRGFVSRFRADFDAHNHDGVNSRRFLTLLADVLSGRVFSIRKSSYTDDTAGFWAGLVSNTVKLYLGTASAYLKWTGTALQIAGDIVAGSITIGNNASIDSSGNATFISMTSLNMKAYTNFETAARFITTGDVAPTFGNQGMTVAPGTTATHYSRALWWITNYVFSNNPSFSCSILALSGFSTGDGVGFIGLGNAALTGSGFTETGKSYCGFEFKKTAGTTSLTAIQCDGGATVDFTNDLTTMVDGDSLELYIKKSSSNIKYYFRKNGGTLTLGATLSNYIPTASETYISFYSSNKGTTDDFKIQVQCAAYEH